MPQVFGFRPCIYDRVGGERGTEGGWKVEATMPVGQVARQETANVVDGVEYDRTLMYTWMPRNRETTFIQGERRS